MKTSITVKQPLFTGSTEGIVKNQRFANSYRYSYQSQEKSDASNPWYQFELRNYNQDLGRWFAPDPYGQFASPYIAMGNNPVSGVDPDGGWVNASPNAGKRFAGKERMDWERATNTGAFSYEATQGRYMNNYQDLIKRYLGAVVGGKRDIDGFYKELQLLNAHYSGLCKYGSVNFSAQNGQQYLTPNELKMGGSMTKNVSETDAGIKQNEVSGFDFNNAMESRIASYTSGDIFENYSSSRYRLKTSGKQWRDGEGNDDGYSVMNIYSDGTTVNTVYNEDGTVVGTIDGYDGSVVNNSVFLLGDESGGPTSGGNTSGGLMGDGCSSSYPPTPHENGDGYISASEAINTWRLDKGKHNLEADLCQLDLTKVKASDFKNGVGSRLVVNFAGNKYTNPTQAVVYGNITLELMEGNKVFAPFQDTYDFDLKLVPGSFKRDVLTMMGNMWNGSGTPYKITLNGTADIAP